MAGSATHIELAGSELGAGEAAAPIPPRLLYVDNLRIFLITLVVVGHMAITYGGGSEVAQWYYHEEGELGEAASIGMTVLLGIGMSFFMGLFFLMAGYFTPRPYDRRGAKRFFLDKLTRLGIPLVFYALVFNPLIIYFVERQSGFQGSIIQLARQHPDKLLTAAVGPLWFVEGLLIFSLVYGMGRWLSDKIPLPFNVKSPSFERVPSNWSIAIFALALGLVTFLVRIWALVGWQWEPPHLELAHFPQYIAMFGVGVMAYRGNWLANFSSRQAKPWPWVGLIFILLMPLLAVAAGALSGELDPAGAGGLTWLSLAYSTWEGFMCVSLVITVLTWFRAKLDRQGKLAKEMAGATYAVYVLHPLIIVSLALWLSSLQLPLGQKFLLVSPLAIAICYLIGILIRKLPLIKSIL